MVVDEAAGIVVLVTDASFDSLVLGSPHPVLLVFSAAWCGPGRLLEPRLTVVAQKLAGRLRVAVVDSDKSWTVTLAHRVFCYPTLLLLHKDATDTWVEVNRVVGARTTRELLALVEPVIGGQA